MNRAQRAQQWAKHVDGWQASALTQREYCERKSISFSTFKRWRRQLGKTQSKHTAATRWVPVKVEAHTAAREAATRTSAQRAHLNSVRGVEVRLISGRSVVLGGEFGEIELARLIRLLEVLPC